MLHFPVRRPDSIRIPVALTHWHRVQSSQKLAQNCGLLQAAERFRLASDLANAAPWNNHHASCEAGRFHVREFGVVARFEAVVLEESNVRRRLAGVLSAVSGIEANAVTSADSPATIAEWDSAGHSQFMLALEDEFSIQFEVSEMASLNSVAAIEKRVVADSLNFPRFGGHTLALSSPYTHDCPKSGHVHSSDIGPRRRQPPSFRVAASLISRPTPSAPSPFLARGCTEFVHATRGDDGL